MKKLLFFVCLIVSVLALHARAIQEDYKNAEEKARVSYAFGMVIGSDLLPTGMEINYAAFADGLKAVFEGAETQFSEQEALEIVETAIQNSIDKRAEVNRRTEEEFLAKNRERLEVHTTPSGLQYEIILETTGEKPGAHSVVRVHYEGSFTDGKLFDSSGTAGGNGVSIPLDRVIPGWTEGIMKMSVGSKYKLFIPSGLAYGKEGIQSMIPPYSTLIFTVELLEITNPENYEDDYEFNFEDEEF
ncbi:MAG: FKBP-type peptidyl-prolyl cis-trans isomerase [Treponema sp.]|jgi:FKBP-type peptidyl-prolyl cis-trans isomerase|nr:FKBP-type peptidyl-prolyl cis-trans isomerase [Treponema sp.]